MSPKPSPITPVEKKAAHETPALVHQKSLKTPAGENQRAFFLFVAAIPLAFLPSILVASQREVHAVFPRHATSSGPR
jgi:hypothetical protein